MEEKPNPTDAGANCCIWLLCRAVAKLIPCLDALAALVEEMLNSLREEVKEMERTNWMYETRDPNALQRINV